MSGNTHAWSESEAPAPAAGFQGEITNTKGPDGGAFVIGEVTSGEYPAVQVKFDDPAELLTCMRKTDSRLCLSVKLKRPVSQGTAIKILIMLPDATSTSLTGHVGRKHGEVSTLLADADETQLEVIRAAMGLG